jgi:hypothetical protein
MAAFFGSRMNRKELLKRTGDMSQLAYIRPFEYTSGKARGIRAFDVSNGTGLDFTVLEDKCLDIIGMKYKGVNLNYLPKSGIVSPALADMNGTEFMRSISGGMLYTCGLLNVGSPCEVDGMTYFFHGRMKNTPADHVNQFYGWEGDDYVLRLSAEMREAAIFSDNLRLNRSLAVKSGDRSVFLTDEIENQGFEAQGLMLLYHINIGYPILDDGARLVIPSKAVKARDDHSQTGIGEYDKITGPSDGFTEHVFLHKMACGSGGKTAAAVINDKLGLGVYVRYSTWELPNLVQWKSMRSGDYAMGMMPSTCNVRGRAEEIRNSELKMIQPFEKLRFSLEIGVLDGKKEISAFEKAIGAYI